MLLTLSVPFTAFAGDGAKTPIPAASVEVTVLVMKSRRVSAAAASSEVAGRDVTVTTDLVAEWEGANPATEHAARERIQRDSFILDTLARLWKCRVEVVEIARAG